MAVERTLSIIKPDATRRNITGKIIDKLESGWPARRGAEAHPLEPVGRGEIL